MLKVPAIEEEPDVHVKGQLAKHAADRLKRRFRLRATYWTVIGTGNDPDDVPSYTDISVLDNALWARIDDPEDYDQLECKPPNSPMNPTSLRSAGYWHVRRAGVMPTRVREVRTAATVASWTHSDGSREAEPSGYACQGRLQGADPHAVALL
jgi:hypothetical protein